MTVRITYLLPRMDECIDSLEDSTNSLTNNFHSANWQIDVSEVAHDKPLFAVIMEYSGLFG